MLAPGTTISGRYRIIALVGSGGMGTVYRARDERLGREVALKVLRPDVAADPKARTHFLREGQIAAQIVHPHVVRTFDVGDTPEGPYLVQEFLPGQTLDQLIPLPPVRAAALLAGVAAALDAIHHHGYLHCDVKPGNILVKADGTPVLLDFGIARAAGIETTTLIATPHYLAPERAQGAPATVASDLYALGIVLYQAVSGQLPFTASSVHAIIEQHLAMPVPSLSIADPERPVLDLVIARLTAKQPSERYPSAAAVQADLMAIASGDIHAQPTAPMTPSAARVSPGGIPASSVASTPRLGAHASGIGRSSSRTMHWRRAAALMLPVLVLLAAFSLVRGWRIPDKQDGAAPPPAPAAVTTATPSLVVPQVVGLQFEAARLLLQARGLGAALEEQRADPRAAGIVLASNPPADTMIPPNSQVLLSISAGPAQPPVSPADSNAAQPAIPLPDDNAAQPAIPLPNDNAAQPSDQNQDQPKNESGDKEQESAKKQEEQQREAAKKQEEQQREAAKKQEEQQREETKKQEEKKKDD